MDLPLVGTRLNLAGNLGTVRYVGSVNNTPGIWLGVDWDDPKRGKHDGIYNGKRYFSCRIPNSGSFIRPNARHITYGVSFIRALTTKYVEQLHGTGTQEAVLLGSSNGAIEVKGVQLDKIRRKLAQLDKLREVSLDSENVASSDPPGTIEITCPNIRNLDLSCSLIPNWDVLAQIVAELPALRSLALNRNRFKPPSDLTKMAASFQHLEELQLNATLTAWSEMLDVITYMPELRLIELGYNHLAHLDTKGDVITHGSFSDFPIHSLNLDGNECKDWPAVCKALNPFPCLRRLVLSSNGIGEIPYPAEGQAPMQGLHHLALTFNRLYAWKDIDALARWCPALQTLALGGNPFVVDQVHAKYARQVTIALLPSLVALDGAAITIKERLDCELFYLSYVAKIGLDTHLTTSEHPRWEELCQKHGVSTPAPGVQEFSDKLSNRLIGIRIYRSSIPPVDPRPAIVEEPTILRVLPTMTLRILRGKVAKSLKAGKKRLSLWLVLDEGTAAAELSTDDDSHNLDRLGIENNTGIIAVISD